MLAVVQKHVENCRPVTFRELEKAFPSALQGSLGVVRRAEDVSEKYKGVGGVKRYFVKDGEVLQLASGEQVLVCTQFGAANMERFVAHAVENLGYGIKRV